MANTASSNPRSLDQILSDLGRPGWTAPSLILFLLFIAILIWMMYAQVDRVVTTQGKVVPLDKVKVVQHLEGGIIERILVRENQTVSAGEPLMQLNLATSGINRGEMEARMASLQLAKIRLEAEASGEKLVWPEQLLLDYPQQIEAEEANYRSRLDEKRNSFQALDSTIKQNRQRAAEARERMKTLRANLEIAQEELELSEALVADQLTSQIEHLQRKNNVENINGEIAQLRQSAIGAEEAIKESIARRNQEEARFQREATNEISDYQRRIASLTQELNRANEQDGRAMVRAPIEGVVKNLRFQASGNVVKPGEPIMEVVPLKDELVVELKLNPSDRGYVHLDQDVLVKISTYDFFRYGGLDGHVSEIAADTDTTKNGEQYYRIVVRTDKTWIGEAEGVYPISPGMTGEVDIKVDTQTIFWSLVRPVLKLKDEALREL